MQNMQQKIIQQSPGGTQQIIQQQVCYERISRRISQLLLSLFIEQMFCNSQVAFQQDSDPSVMGQPHNQTILITGNQTQTQQSARTPPMQQMSQQVI